MITIVSVLVTLTITFAYYLLRQNYRYWKKRGVTGPKPRFFVGNLGKSFLLKAQPGEIFTEAYDQYSGCTTVGLYRALTPILLIRDPDLIKEITVKSFHNFHDNDIEVDKKSDPLFGRHPFVLKGEEWKVVRAQLTPGFTSGKMKWLYPYLETNSQKMLKFIEKTPEAFNGKGYEAKELCTRFTLNNVADSVFGVDGKCFDEDNSEFRQLAKDFLSPGSWTVFLIFVSTILPAFAKLLPIGFTAKSVEKKLTDIVTSALKHREENNIVRNDFLDIISRLKETCKDYVFTNIDVTAHAAGFFADGYETSSIVMSFILFQLSANPEAQSKLREEVGKVFAKNNNTFPYEELQSLDYLDAIVNESLRVTPPLYSLQKICTEDFTFVPKESNKAVVIEKGTPIVLPVFALQRDPKYFEEPDLFKPERFLGENKNNIKKCTFMPFGEGPRACLGQRFGLLQIKVGVAYIVQHYELSINKKTKLPLKFDPTYFLITPIGGLWLDFKKIK